jgi:hypothetical protein
VEHALGGTLIATDGTNLNLAGVTFGRFNVFTERASLGFGPARGCAMKCEIDGSSVTRRQESLGAGHRL